MTDKNFENENINVEPNNNFQQEEAVNTNAVDFSAANVQNINTQAPDHTEDVYNKEPENINNGTEGDLNAQPFSPMFEEEQPVYKKKPYSYKRSIAVGLTGAILCGASIGLTLGLGLYIGKANIIPSLTTRPTSQFAFNEDASSKEDSAEKSEDMPIVNTSSDLTTSRSTIAKVVDDVEEAVVNINIKTSTMGYFNQVYEGSGAGSGIIYKETEDKLYIITNNHVVESATACSISIDGENYVDANLVGKDASTDLAVISVDKSKLKDANITDYTVAKFGNSDELAMGETVIALGNALGEGKTATIGIISSTGKKLDIDGTKYDVLQTDAAINPGNSGGALVNTEGEVIGVNSAKLAATAIEGVGYAIPSARAMEVCNELIEKGTIQRAWLGVSIYTINDEFKQMYNVNTDGVLITKIEQNSAAEKAGLQETDIITKADGKEITTSTELSDVIEAHQPGDKVDLTIVRDGYKEMNVTVTLENLNTGF